MFDQFTIPMFTSLLQDMKLLELEKGEKLYDIGDSSDFWYFVLEGGLLLCIPSTQSKNYTQFGQNK